MGDAIFQNILDGFLGSLRMVWGEVWWIVTPIIAAILFWEYWKSYLTFRFLSAIKWKLLEIKVPKDILQTPKSMEQVFAAAHGPFTYGLRFLEKHWEGKREYSMSFEIVGIGGDIHFYLRVPAQFQSLMESAIYGQYPQAEIKEIPVDQDYVRQMPPVLPNKKFQTHGIEFILEKPAPYPIRTYPMFEDAVEERRVDPIGNLTEILSRLKKDEQVWIQILVTPTGPPENNWRKEGEDIINKIMGRDTEKKKESTPLFGVTIGEAVRAPWEHPSQEVEKKKDGMDFKFVVLSPSEKEVVEGIERKTSKLGFESTVRFIYIDDRENFSRDNVAGVMGSFRQYNTQNLNLLRPNKHTMSASVHGLFKPMRLNWRRRVMYERYGWLSHGPGASKNILNIEELATLFHFPITGVQAPQLQRIEAKKGSPPPTIPLID